MSKKHISLVIALLAAGGAAACGAGEAYAQDSGTGPVPVNTQVMPPPPPPSTGGNMEPARMPPPPGGMQQGEMGGERPNFSGERMPPQGGMQGGMMPPTDRQFGQSDFGSANRMPPPPYGGGFGGQQGQRLPMQKGMMQQGQMQQGMDGREQKQMPGQQFQGGERTMPFGMQGKMQGGKMESGSQNEQGLSGGTRQQEGGDSEGGDGEMQKQQLAQMKRNIKGMEQGLAQIKKSIERLQKKNIAVPAEYTGTITALTEAVATIKAATEPSDAVEAAMETLMDKSEDLRDIGPHLGMLEQWPKMLAQAEKQLKRQSDSLAKAKKKKGAEQYSAVISKVEAAVSAASAKLAEIKQQGDSGDIEAAMEGAQDLQELMQDSQEQIQLLDQLGNLPRMIKNAEKEIAGTEKQVQRISKKGTDTSSVTKILTEARGKLSELKALGSNASASADDYFEAMHSLEELRQEAMKAYDALTGAATSEGAAVMQSIRQLREGR